MGWDQGNQTSGPSRIEKTSTLGATMEKNGRRSAKYFDQPRGCDLPIDLC